MKNNSLNSQELLLLFATHIKKELGKLEPLQNYLLEQSSSNRSGQTESLEFQKMKGISNSLLATTHSLLDLLDSNTAFSEEIPFSLRSSLAKVFQTQNQLLNEYHGSFEFFIHPQVPDSLLGSPAILKHLTSLFLNHCPNQENKLKLEVKTSDKATNIIFELNFELNNNPKNQDSLRLQSFLFSELCKKWGANFTDDPKTNRMRLEVPVRLHDFAEEPETKRFNLMGKRVLLIDSSPSSLELLARLLGSWKLETLYANSIFEARQLCEQNEQVDFVIFEKDLLDSKEFEWIKSLKQNKADTLFILVTSHPERGDAALCGKHGINAYLTQPLHGIELWEVLQYLLNNPVDTLVTRHVLKEQDRHFKILVWDPKHENKEKLFQLKSQGHAIHEMNDSEEIYNKLSQTAYDLVLLDRESIKSRLEFSQLRQNNKNTRTPIIGFGKHSSKSGQTEGFDAILHSPLKDEDLFSLLGHSS